ncbi:molybdopterin converting factor subunit 1 [Myxococcota bacterium]|nr:molybdopterin converting factor subunit 1 [Myxococcota bacterium]
MRISVRLFAVCRERAGTDRLDVELVGEPASVADLRRALAAASPALAPLLPIVRIAINETFVRDADPVRPGDEVALIPPVSGGSGLGPFELRTTPIGLDEVERAVARPEAGALVSFAGTVRSKTAGHDVVALEYEAYDSMALRFLRAIGDEVRGRWPEASIAILHRTGHLEVGEISVVIAVSSPHRADAFEGCRHAIERLKQDVPIWKKEIRSDGSIWVGVGS